MTVEQTLMDRGVNYGNFAARARIEQGLIETMECSGGWHRLSPAQKSSARMIAVKLSRILNCNPDHRDSWIDIAGYATAAAGDGE
jgi:hypothetical protein